MNKSHAIQFINSIIKEPKLNYSNCSFASINKTVPVWWLNIHPRKFEDDFYLILDDSLDFILIFLPKGAFPNPVSSFSIRADNNLVDLRISCDQGSHYLKDQASGGNGNDFQNFVKGKFSYPESLKSEAPAKIRSGSKRIGKPEVKMNQEILKQNQTGVSYEKLFAKYLIGAKNITLQDPYIRLPNQFKNLLEFCVMLGNYKEPVAILNLKIITWNTLAFKPTSKELLQELSSTVKQMGIVLTYKFENHHDRYIEADNGWKIILGRGLDIFEKTQGRFVIGDIDQTWRKCKPCEMTYLKI